MEEKVMSIWENNQRVMERERLEDSKKKSARKTISWRLIAVVNSFLILTVTWTDSPLWNALWMNLTGAVLYYIHERLWKRIS